EPAPHEGALKTALVIDECVDGDVARLSLEDNRCFLERRAAPPAPYCPGIARCGRMAVAECTRDVERVCVVPASGGLRFRQNESIRDEFTYFEIKLADDGCIGAAPREHNQSPAMIGRQGHAAMPDPVLTFLAPERIDIDQHVPFGHWRAIGL